jgi:periplasmic divalent cation tolerance protein
MYQTIFCSCPTREQAKRLAQLLVEQQLVACVNLLPHIESIYQWQGKIECSDEVLLMMKTHQDNFQKISQVIKANHPYDVVEIIALPIEQANAEYLAWIDDVLALHK